MAQGISRKQAEANYPLLLDTVVALVTDLNVECKQSMLV